MAGTKHPRTSLPYTQLISSISLYRHGGGLNDSESRNAEPSVSCFPLTQVAFLFHQSGFKKIWTLNTCIGERWQLSGTAEHCSQRPQETVPMGILDEFMADLVSCRFTTLPLAHIHLRVCRHSKRCQSNEDIPAHQHRMHGPSTLPFPASVRPVVLGGTLLCL